MLEEKMVKRRDGGLLDKPRKDGEPVKKKNQGIIKELWVSGLDETFE